MPTVGEVSGGPSAASLLPPAFGELLEGLILWQRQNQPGRQGWRRSRVSGFEGGHGAGLPGAQEEKTWSDLCPSRSDSPWAI